MTVKVLAENTTSSNMLESEHGLSLYIETKSYKILFDTGASDLFAKNAEKMGVDIGKVDLAVISHGHYDHGGGIKTFLGINNQAKIYLCEKAFEQYYSDRSGSTKEYIGLDKSLLPNDRFVFCGEHFVIDENLELFSGVDSKRFAPFGNTSLFMKNGDTFVQDTFAHEQNLIVNKKGKTILIAGCAHKGIINIVDKFKAMKGYMPDYVIGGFHLHSRGTNQNEAPHIVDEIGNILKETGSKFYTCHCTGIDSYNRLKTVMGESIEYISTGDTITI